MYNSARQRLTINWLKSTTINCQMFKGANWSRVITRARSFLMVFYLSVSQILLMAFAP